MLQIRPRPTPPAVQGIEPATFGRIAHLVDYDHALPSVQRHLADIISEGATIALRQPKLSVEAANRMLEKDRQQREIIPTDRLGKRANFSDVVEIRRRAKPSATAAGNIVEDYEIDVTSASPILQTNCSNSAGSSSSSSSTAPKGSVTGNAGGGEGAAGGGDGAAGGGDGAAGGGKDGQGGAAGGGGGRQPDRGGKGVPDSTSRKRKAKKPATPPSSSDDEDEEDPDSDDRSRVDFDAMSPSRTPNQTPATTPQPVNFMFTQQVTASVPSYSKGVWEAGQITAPANYKALMAKRVRDILPEIQNVIANGGQIQVHAMFEPNHKVQVLNDLDIALMDCWNGDREVSKPACLKWPAYNYRDQGTGVRLVRQSQFLTERPTKSVHGTDSFYSDLIKLYPMIVTANEEEAEVKRLLLNIINRWLIHSPQVEDRKEEKTQASLRDQLLLELSKLGKTQGIQQITVEDSQLLVEAIIKRFKKLEQESKVQQTQRYCTHVLTNWQDSKEDRYLVHHSAGHVYPPLWVFLNFIDKVDAEMIKIAKTLATQGLNLFSGSNQAATEKQKEHSSEKASTANTNSGQSDKPKKWGALAEKAAARKKLSKEEIEYGTSFLNSLKESKNTDGKKVAEKGSGCLGCGNWYHEKTKCSFKDHPDYQKDWPNSDMAKNYKKVTRNGRLTPRTHILPGLRINIAKDNNGAEVFTLVDTDLGPKKPEKVGDTISLPNKSNSVIITTEINLSSVYENLDRKDLNVGCRIEGIPATLLVDTGATEYNYISREFCLAHKLPQYELKYNINVQSVHGKSITKYYTIVNIEVITNYSLISLKHLPCIILDNCPRELIIGLPSISKHNLMHGLKSYFEAHAAQHDAQYKLMFPKWRHNPLEQASMLPERGSALVPPSSSLVSAALSNVHALSTMSSEGYSIDRLTVCYGIYGLKPPTPSTFPLVERGSLVSPLNHLRDTLDPTPGLIPKNDLLDADVPADTDGATELDDQDKFDKMEMPKHSPGVNDGVNLIEQIQLHGSRGLKKRLKKLIKTYESIFKTTLPTEPGDLTPMTFAIDMAQWRNDRRSKQYPRPLSKEKEEALTKWIEAALKSGIISEAPTVPNWSQVVMVLKPGGKEYRFCVDYTVLNIFMESAGWPIPHIGSILRRIANHRPKFFGTMDATQGFYQMEVELDYREFLCFTTFMGNYIWNRAPMGPKTVPAAFQRAMCVEVFPDLVHKIMEIYIDDFIVWADTEDELITRLESIFSRIRDKKLYLNPKKCRFGMDEVVYCGHVINSRGVTFSKERIDEVADMEAPQTHGALKSFLGMAGYMREHINHYVDLVNPLQEIVKHYTKKTRKLAIDWTPELLHHFQKFKDAIRNVDLLYHRDEACQLRLYTDASKYGIGAYLCQIVATATGEEQEQPLAFISKSLSDTERRWSVYEKEAYAIFYSCRKWEHFLRGNHFHLFTDHKNLTFLNRPPSEKVMRWRLAIQEFDFSVAYIKGERNNVADGMSRCLPNSTQDDISEESRPTLLQYLKGEVDLPPIIPGKEDWYAQLEREQREQFFVPNTEYTLFCSLISGHPVSASELNKQPHCKEEHCKERHTVISPIMSSLLCPLQGHPLAEHEQAASLPTNIQEILQSVHNAEVGHGGVERTLDLIQQLRTKNQHLTEILDNWHTKRADTKRFVKQCPVCQKIKSHQLRKYTPHYVLSTYGIFDNLSIDTVYMPENTRGQKYLIVIIDSFSRYTGVYPVADLTAQGAMEVLLKWISDFGIPSHLCCDNGSQFRGIFEELLDLLSVNHYTIQAYSHQENGIVERANKEVLTVLRCLVLEKRLRNDWDILCHVAKRIINSRVHSAIGVSPADLVFGGRIDLQRGSLFPYSISEEQATPDYLYQMQLHQVEMLRKATRIQNAVNAKRLKEKQLAPKTTFAVHSYVLVQPEVKPNDKLAPQWLGPYQILEHIEKREGDLYRCLHLSTNREFTFRVNQLNPFYFDDDAVLHQTAQLDHEQYEIEAVIQHRYNGSHTIKNLQLEIKWMGYDETEWQNYSEGGLNEVDVVHEYLRRHKMVRFIPPRFKNYE